MTNIEIVDILDKTYCTYSCGLIEGTISVKDAGDDLLRFLLDTDHIADDMRTRIHEYLRNHFGEKTGHNWEMPKTVEVFCVIP